MVVINPKTGLRYDTQNNHGDSLLFKTSSDYYLFVMQNFREDYYTSDLFRGEVDKILGVLDE